MTSALSHAPLDTGSVHALPVPWQHFVCLLDASKAKKPEVAEQDLFTKLMSLLDTMLEAKHALSSAAIEASKPDPTDSASGGRGGGGLMSSGRGTPSFNLLLTRRAIHLIPRRREEYKLDGDWEKVNGKQLGEMSINAMGESFFRLHSTCSGPVPASDWLTLSIRLCIVRQKGFAGMLLVKHPSEVEAVRKLESGVTSILAHVGMPPAPGVSHPEPAQHI